MNRREFLKGTGLAAASVCICPFAGCRSRTNATRAGRLDIPTQETDSLAANVKRTEQSLRAYPITYKRLATYIDQIKDRMDSTCSSEWVSYQNDRLNRIRWLVAKNDDGTESGMRLKMRPYDIPWLVWCMGVTADEKGAKEYGQEAFNGSVENMEKVLCCPLMEIEFTDRFADFCYLCSHLTTEGCANHAEFEGYGKEFPQPVQISPSLRNESDLALEILGLNRNDTVTSTSLLTLCVEKAPDPAEHDAFPLDRDYWDNYRKGIRRIGAEVIEAKTERRGTPVWSDRARL